MGFLDGLFKRWRGRGPAPMSFDVVADGAGAPARRVLIFTEHVNATYHLYVHLPLTALHAQGRVNFAVLSQERLKRLGADTSLEALLEGLCQGFAPEIVVFTRYAEPWGPDIQQYFIERGLPTVYHLDDDLFEIPDSLGSAIQQRHGRAVSEARARMLTRATWAYASTPFLRDSLARRFPDQRFRLGPDVPYLADALGEPPAAVPGASPIIGYMGSKGHRQDLAMITPAIAALLAARPGLRFETFGTIGMPEALARFGDRVASHSARTDYMAFLRHLMALRWDIGLAPLQRHDFNHAKTPVKFVEYTACGVPTIASDVGVYAPWLADGRGSLAGDDQWLEAMASLLDDAPGRAHMVARARAFCADRFAPVRLERQWDALIGILDEA